jgi:hypothetical protein
MSANAAEIATMMKAPPEGALDDDDAMLKLR